MSTEYITDTIVVNLITDVSEVVGKGCYWDDIVNKPNVATEEELATKQDKLNFYSEESDVVNIQPTDHETTIWGEGSTYLVVEPDDVTVKTPNGKLYYNDVEVATKEDLRSKENTLYYYNEDNPNYDGAIISTDEKLAHIQVNSDEINLTSSMFSGNTVAVSSDGVNINTTSNNTFKYNGTEVATITPSGDPMHYLFTDKGAVYNTSTGYWELNGLTDITNEQMRTIYNCSMYNPGSPLVAGQYAGIKARTIFPATSSAAGIINSQQSNGFETFISCNNLEVLTLSLETSEAYYILFAPSQMIYTFANCTNLKTINGHLDVRYITSFNNVFRVDTALEKVLLTKLNANISFEYSPNLNKASILYMIQNAINASSSKQITITLHSTALAMAQKDSDIQSALTENGYITLA